MTSVQSSQVVAEVALVGNPKAQISQMVAEALVKPSVINVCCSQLVAEILYDPGPVNAECSQVVIEILGVFVSSGGGSQGSSAMLMHL